jgi:hypothetical protein
MAESILTRWTPMTAREIVGNVSGTNQDQVAQTLGGNLGGQGGGLIKQLLPILAPIVLAYLSKRLTGQRQGARRRPE